ncbi:unnamed protein product [Camellia sinensis]
MNSNMGFFRKSQRRQNTIHIILQQRPNLIKIPRSITFYINHILYTHIPGSSTVSSFSLERKSKLFSVKSWVFCGKSSWVLLDVDVRNGKCDKLREVSGGDTNMGSRISHYSYGFRLPSSRTIHLPIRKWLKKTRRKALFASLEKIKEELMLLGLISLMLGQWAGWISQICVNSSLFSSQFYLCSEEDYGKNENILLTKTFSSLNESDIPPGVNYPSSRQCGEGHEPFVSYEGLEQLHRFLFVLGVTHVLYSCVVVGLAMSKIYSWRKWENEASLALDANLQDSTMPAWKPCGSICLSCDMYKWQLLSLVVMSPAESSELEGLLCRKKAVNKVMKRQSTFVLHHASHPWSRSRVLIWMLCFLQQFKSSIQKSDYLALRLGFITVVYVVRSMEDEFYGIVGISWPLWGYAILCFFINIHGSNIYFWLSFIPAIHVVSLLALETLEPRGQPIGTQVKPRDELFWFGKPEILLWLIQFISFQNAFEMATFIWSLWGFKQRSCFMDNHAMIIIRLISGYVSLKNWTSIIESKKSSLMQRHTLASEYIKTEQLVADVLVQFWCSYSTVPLNVLITQMGSKCKKAVIAESVRESLHTWCKRVRARSKRDALHSLATRSTCSLESIIDERDEIITVGSGTLSRSSSIGTLDHVELNVTSATEQLEKFFETSIPTQHELSFQMPENPSETVADGAEDDNYLHGGEGGNDETLFELFQKT